MVTANKTLPLHVKIFAIALVIVIILLTTLYILMPSFSGDMFASTLTLSFITGFIGAIFMLTYVWDAKNGSSSPSLAARLWPAFGAMLTLLAAICTVTILFLTSDLSSTSGQMMVTTGTILCAGALILLYHISGKYKPSAEGTSGVAGSLHEGANDMFTSAFTALRAIFTTHTLYEWLRFIVICGGSFWLFSYRQANESDLEEGGWWWGYSQTVLFVAGITSFAHFILTDKVVDEMGPFGAFIKSLKAYLPCLMRGRSPLEWAAGLVTFFILLIVWVKGFINPSYDSAWWWIVQIISSGGLLALFKLFSGPKEAKDSPLRNFISALSEYIPCILAGQSPKTPTEKRDMQLLTVGLAIGAILYIMANYTTPWAVNRFFQQGGTQLLNEPQSLTRTATLSAAPDNPGKNHRYGVGFWLYIDSFSLNTNAGYTDPKARVFSYGGLPHIIYDATGNALEFSAKSDSYTSDELSTSETQVLYRHPDVKLQRWNYIVVNCVGGTVDIFINGELQSSTPGVSPYQDQAIMEYGEDGGIHGDICNVMYYDNPLSVELIERMYIAFRDRNPPKISTTIWTLTPLG